MRPLSHPAIVEVKGGQVKEVTVAKTARLNIRAKSFTFPVERWGDVKVEYPVSFGGQHCGFQGPRHQGGRHGFSDLMTSYPFNVEFEKWEPVTAIAGRQGFVKTSVRNVPAFVREPRMPDEDDVRAWILVYYTDNGRNQPEKYWPGLGRKLNDEFRKGVRITNEIKAAAAEVAGQLTTPTAKANALAYYCQTQIRNVSFQAEGMKAQDRDEFFKSKLKDDTVYTSADAFKNKIGRPQDIRLLFFALAEAAGLNPVFAAASSTDGPVFRRDFLDPYFIKSNVLVGIPENAEGKLRFYNPGSPYLPAGMADEELQGQPALICHSKGPKLDLISSSSPEQSAQRRSADFKLTAEGSISGKVRIVSTGYEGVLEKRAYDGLSPADRESSIRKQLEAQYPAAQISNLVVEHADTTAGDFTISFDIAMESYAQRAGKRLFLQPGFFQYSEKPVFSASTRRYPIQYDHPWIEVDAIMIETPEGFTLDAADMPGAIKLGEVGDYSFSASYRKEARKLTVKRNLSWGKSGATWFEPKFYTAIKGAWDKLHAADTHQITFKSE